MGFGFRLVGLGDCKSHILKLGYEATSISIYVSPLNPKQ